MPSNAARATAGRPETITKLPAKHAEPGKPTKRLNEFSSSLFVFCHGSVPPGATVAARSARLGVFARKPNEQGFRESTKGRLTNLGYSFIREAFRLLRWCRAANWAGAGVRPLCPSTEDAKRSAIAADGEAKRSRYGVVVVALRSDEGRASLKKEARGGCVGWGAIKAGKVKRSPECDLVPGGA
jgi:hypothetical protein